MKSGVARADIITAAPVDVSEVVMRVDEPAPKAATLRHLLPLRERRRRRQEGRSRAMRTRDGNALSLHAKAGSANHLRWTGGCGHSVGIGCFWNTFGWPTKPRLPPLSGDDLAVDRVLRTNAKAILSFKGLP